MELRKQIEEILLNNYGCFDDFTVDKLLDLFAVSNSDCSCRPNTDLYCETITYCNKCHKEVKKVRAT